jgi:hypothetical protein
MKIQPISTWKNGEEIEATDFLVSINGDNCSDMAVIAYQLFAEGQPPVDGDAGTLGELLITGQLVIQGEDYQTWDTDPGANAWIYNWAAGQLKLTIIPDAVVA